jgi:hypothetical protein
MYKRAFVIAAALCAAATMTIGTVASASGDEGRRVQFVVHSLIPPSQFLNAYVADTSRCTFNATFTNVESPCVTPITPTEPTPGAYNEQVTGDFVGFGEFAKSAVLGVFNDLPTLDIPSTNYEPFSLTIAGCGTGTVIVRTEGNLDSTNGRWKFVPNSGRKGLTGVSGSGTYTVSHNNPGGTESNIAVGHVRCSGEHDE